MKYFLSIDIGTTNVKVALLNERGDVIRVIRREVPLYSPEPGAAEHDADEIVNLVAKASRELVKGVNEEVTAVCTSSYLFGLLPVSRDGKPLRRLITWMDTRPERVIGELYREVDVSELYERTGCPPLPIYQLPKIVWLREREPDLFQRTAYFFNIKDYFYFKLTKEAVGDYSSWSGSQLLNMSKLKWDDLALRLASIGEGKLPTLMEGLEWIELTDEGAKILGVRKGTKLVMGVFDGAAVALGLGCVKEGIGAVNLGSSAMVRVISDRPVVDKDPSMRFQTYYLFNRKWLPGGAINNAGLVLRWFKERLGTLEVLASEILSENPYAILCKEASKSPPGCRGLMFLPFLVGERLPTVGGSWARACLIGLSYYHSRSDIIRSFMEGVALTLKIIWEALKENGIEVGELRCAGKGAASELWLRILADVMNTPILRSYDLDASNIGNTILAALASGEVSDLDEGVSRFVKLRGRIIPSVNGVKIYSKLYRLFKQVAWDLRDTLKELRELPN